MKDNLPFALMTLMRKILKTKCLILAVFFWGCVSSSIDVYVTAEAVPPPDVEWQKSRNVLPNLRDFLIQHTDGRYTVCDFYSTELIKLEANGDEIWRQSLSAIQTGSLAAYPSGLLQKPKNEDIQRTADGGYLLQYKFGGNSAYSEYALVKLTPSGDVAWKKLFLNGRDRIESVRQTEDGGYIVGGRFEKENSNESTPGYDRYNSIIKLDGAGNKTGWGVSFFVDRDDIPGLREVGSCSFVQQTSDGGYIVIGNPLFNEGDWQQSCDVIKVNADGSTAWSKRINQSGAPFFTQLVQETQDGGYIFKTYDGSGSDYFVKLSSNGAELWKTRTVAMHYYYAMWCQETSDGGCVLWGNCGTGTTTIIKINSSGGEAWRQEFPGVSINSLEQAYDEGYIVSLGLGGNTGYPPIIKLRSDNGKPHWEHWLPTLNDPKDYCSYIRQTKDGGYIAIGNFGLIKLAPDEDEASAADLKVVALERGRPGLDESFDGEALLRDTGIICVVPSGKTSTEPYRDCDGKEVDETSVFKLPAFKPLTSEAKSKTYYKEGLTADGNTRLILRAQTTQAGASAIKFTLPFTLGGITTVDVLLEQLTKRSNSDSTSIEVPTTEVTTGVYQASAVLIAPKDYPAALGTNLSRRHQFQIKVEAFDQARQKITENSLNLTLRPSPVLLIHGIWGSEGTFEGDHGIEATLLEAKFRVNECKYGGTVGPTELITGTGASKIFQDVVGLQIQENEELIACTKVDFVTHSMGGLVARKFLQDDLGNKKSIRSYKQGMVRRVITVATPHAGSPWASYLLGADYDSDLHLNMDNKSETEVKVASLLRSERGTIQKFIQDTMGESSSALGDMAISSPKLKKIGFPAVPMYAIYGGIKSCIPALSQAISETSIPDGVIFIADILPINHELASCIKAIGIDVLGNSDGLEALFKLLFGSDDHDIAVSQTSATKGFGNSVKDYKDLLWWYNHLRLTKQSIVGEKVMSLLSGPEVAFINFGGISVPFSSPITTYQRATQRNFVPTVTASGIEKNFTITADTQSIQAPGTIKLTCTSSKPVTDTVILMIELSDGTKIINLKKGADNTYSTTLKFAKEDTGILNASCFAKENGIIYDSESITLAVRADPAQFSSIYWGSHSAVLVGEKIGLGLYAKLPDGKKRNVSSPLMGTVYSANDSSLFSITDDGKIIGLKAGTTVLTATYNGFTAERKITIMPALGDSSTDPVVPENPSVVQPISVAFVDGTTNLSLNIGGERLLAVQISPANATETILSWKVGNNSLLSLVPVGTATTTQSARITALAEGVTTVTVTTSNGHEATVNVTVTPKKNNPNDPKNEEGGSKGSGGCTAGVGLDGLAWVLLLMLVFTKYFRRKKVERGNSLRRPGR